MRKVTLGLLASCLFAAGIASTGCKKEPPPSPGPAEQPRKEELAPKAESKPAGGGEAAKAEKTSTEGAAKAKEKGEKQGAATTTTGEEGRKAKALGKYGMPGLPPARIERTLRKVTGWGVTGPIDKTRDTVISLLPPEIQVQAREEFDKKLAELAKKKGLKNLEWLDRSRGVAFGFEGKDKPIVAVPIVDLEKFVAALPEGVVADTNNGYPLDENVYIMPAGGRYLFVSDSFRTIDIIEGDLKLELTRISTDKLLTLSITGESLKTLVSMLLDGVERKLGENMAMQQEQKEFLAKLFNFIREVLGDVEKATLGVEVTGGNLVLRYEVETLAGSKLAQSLEALRPGSFASAGLLPSKSFMVMGQNIPSDAVTPWLPRYVDLVATAWKLGPEERSEFTKLYAKMLQLFGPDSAFAMYSDAGFPLAMTAVSQSSSGMQAREVLYAFYDHLLEKMIKQLPAEQQKQLANRSFRDIVLSISPVLQNLGVGVKVDVEDYRGGKIDSILFTFDWEKLGPRPSVQEVVGTQLGGALGFNSERVVMAFGPNPVVRVKEVLDATPGLSVEKVAGEGSTQGKYVMFFNLSLRQLVNDLLAIKMVADAAAGQDWVSRLLQIEDVRVVGGTLKKTLWLELQLGVKSILEAFEHDLLRAVESPAASTSALPAGN